MQTHMNLHISCMCTPKSKHRHTKHTRIFNPGLLLSYIRYCVYTHVCSWLHIDVIVLHFSRGAGFNTSDRISLCSSVGQTPPLYHLAASGYVSPVSYSMSLAAFSFWSLRALLRQCCQWVLQSTVVSSKSSDVILHFLSCSWPLKCFPCTHTDRWYYVNG